MLVRRGWSVNLKRVRRLWISLGLRRPVRLRKPRKLGPKPGVSANSCTQQPARFKNDVWTCDFIHDRTAQGGSLKWLTLVDEYTRECLVLHAAGSITGADVRRILARVIGRRGCRPASGAITDPNSFVRHWLDGYRGWVLTQSRWLRGALGRTHISNRFTVDCGTSSWNELNSSQSRMLGRKASGTVGNTTRCRPHSSLDYATPKEFSASCDRRRKGSNIIL